MRTLRRMQLAGDRERETAAASLREHFVGGRLTVEELADRTEAALRARSRGDLRRSLEGLPQFNAGSFLQGATRVAAVVLFTGAWLMFSFALLVVLGLTALIHGVSGAGLLGFLLVWLVPTYLLTRVWRTRGPRR
jgi:uncharacterized protein DUF1707